MMKKKSFLKKIVFSKLVDAPIYMKDSKEKLGSVTDLVFNLTEPFPENVGIHVELGWNKPDLFIPWKDIVEIEDGRVTVQTLPDGTSYPTFVDQPGWILVNDHLIGRTILDLDGRKVEVVNDVLLLKSTDRMILVSVDISFNGFLRRWGVGWLQISNDHFIPWKYVQPLSIEDVGRTDSVHLSLTRKQIKAFPPEDLADALEELSGKQQQAIFSALETDKAASVLAEAEARTQRQLIANLRFEKAKAIFSQMSTLQLVSLFSVLSHDQRDPLLNYLPEEQAKRVKTLMSEHESAAKDLISQKYCAVKSGITIKEVMQLLRTSKFEYRSISYVYVVNDEHTLIGIADLRRLVLGKDQDPIDSVIFSPVVVAEEDDNKDDLREIFTKYHYRMIPVVDKGDHILGVIYYKDIMK